MALKTEALGLAVMTELPLVSINVQRGGPSTGLPTKTEQSDLLQAVYGRNGEAPIPVIAASTPGNCFEMAFEAFRIATKYMTPVILLSDGYIANGAEPWLIPAESSIPELIVKFRTEKEGFAPYLRDENLARPWAVPGTSGLEHRIGGLEKANITGNVSHDPDNHHMMCELRAQKVMNIANDIPDVEIFGEEKGEILVLGWGGTYGAIRDAVIKAQKNGMSVSHAHLHYINPFPKNLENILKNFNKILVPELNLGQLSKILRIEYLIAAESFCKVKGLPFTAVEIYSKISSMSGGEK